MTNEMKQIGVQHGQAKLIADRAGVSTATVSKVLNGHEGVKETTKLRIAKAIRAVVSATARARQKTEQLLNPAL